MQDAYDFNEVFGALKVYDQGANDTCFYFSRALVAAAKAKVHGEAEPTWNEFAPPAGAWVVKDGVYGWEMTINGAKYWVAEAASSPAKTDHDAVKQALLDSGVLMVAVEIPESLKLFDQSKMPVIVVKSGDNHVSAHSLLAVGYTADGVIVQSSWGKRWGYQGRAILSWEWWDNFAVNAVPPRVNGWPIKDMPDPLPKPAPAPTPTPAPTPAPVPSPTKEAAKMLVVRRKSGSAVFAITGGVRSWVRSRTILERQGVTMNDVKVLPDNDILFTLPIVGPVPPEK